MKKFNPIAIFTLIVLIVTICIVSIPFIVGSIKETNTKSFVDGHICSVCGDEAVTIAGMREYYCLKCYDNKFGDVPTKSYPGLFD